MLQPVEKKYIPGHEFQYRRQSCVYMEMLLKLFPYA